MNRSAKVTTIYALADPRYYDDVVRYVGKTCLKPERRLGNHVTESKRLENHRHKWIQSLGMTPRLIILAVVQGDGCAEEIGYIKEYRALGLDLVNQTDGGEGRTGQVVSKETREKLSRTFKGRKHTPEAIEKIRKNRGPLSEQGKANIAESNRLKKTGFRHSPETLEKMRVAHLQTHCKNGHPLADSYVHVKTGHRHCRPCKAQAMARYYARRKGLAAPYGYERLAPARWSTPSPNVAQQGAQGS